MGIEAELVEGRPGQLEVAVDGVVVATRAKGFWRRFLGGGWPEPAEVIEAIRARRGD